MFAQGCSFNHYVDNFGATYSDAGLGTAVTGAGTAHTRGTAVTLLSATSEPSYGIQIALGGLTTAGFTKYHLASILIDHAGGTSWSDLIPNLLAAGCSWFSSGTISRNFGHWYYFPLFIPAGASIGCQTQCAVTTASVLTIRVGVRLFQRPTRIEHFRYGQFVRTFGANTATTSGTAVTTGNQVNPVWSSIGTTAEQLFWWQCGMNIHDGNIATQVGMYCDMAVGDASNKYFILGNNQFYCDTSEYTSCSCGTGNAYYEAPAGVNVYGRIIGYTSAGEGGPVMIAYGVGG